MPWLERLKTAAVVGEGRDGFEVRASNVELSHPTTTSNPGARTAGARGERSNARAAAAQPEGNIAQDDGVVLASVLRCCCVCSCEPCLVEAGMPRSSETRQHPGWRRRQW